uniref:Uncharacterized protein n=1 Tax=Anguilla anguilla TaxID=7936 RepID=A0A0E9TY00_ANGAN
MLTKTSLPAADCEV